MRRPRKAKRTGEERCARLSQAAALLSLNVTGLLKDAEAPKMYAKYRAFLRSLDGAIRHAQRQRDEEYEVLGRDPQYLAHVAEAKKLCAAKGIKFYDYVIPGR